MHALKDAKTEKVAEIIRRVYPDQIERMLVVGCGDGIEAAILARELGSKVVGIDVVDAFNEIASHAADLRLGDATDLEFEDESFDFVFSYHALEHISDPDQALREMHRVLRPGAGFWIGTPNRMRLVGYIGAKEGTMSEKIRWNLSDYRARIIGKFRNEYGAHAGFSSRELGSMLSAVFSVVNDVSLLYFTTIYARYRWAAGLAGKRPLADYIYPSVYFSGMK